MQDNGLPGVRKNAGSGARCRLSPRPQGLARHAKSSTVLRTFDASHGRDQKQQHKNTAEDLKLQHTKNPFTQIRKSMKSGPKGQGSDILQTARVSFVPL